MNANPAAATQTFPNAGGAARSVLRLVSDGADSEDEGRRSPNHHYDPITDMGLHWSAFHFTSSRDWATESGGQISEQVNSVRDAVEYFNFAIVSPTEKDRKDDFGRLFQTLGHVINLLQDMAQPQHVRNDDHCDNTLCQSSYVLYKPSGYELYTGRLRNVATFPAYPIAFDAAGTTTFGKATLFWKNGGRGIAEFTNSNLVTAQTNFRGLPPASIVPQPDYLLPNGAGATIESARTTDLLGPTGPNPPLTGELRFIGTAINDSYLVTPVLRNQRTSSLSILDADLTQEGKSNRFTLNRFNED